MAKFGMAPALYCTENPAKFWSGGGGERASLVAVLRSVQSDGYPLEIRPKRRRKPAATPILENRQNCIAMVYRFTSAHFLLRSPPPPVHLRLCFVNP
jgi:hypothetical protein